MSCDVLKKMFDIERKRDRQTDRDRDREILSVFVCDRER